MMHHSVPIGGSRDQACLGAVNPVRAERPWPVSAIDEFLLETEEMGFLMELKPLHDFPISLAPLRLAGSQEQVFPGNHLAPEIAVSFHDGGLAEGFEPAANLRANLNHQLAAVAVAVARERSQVQGLTHLKTQHFQFDVGVPATIRPSLGG